MNHNTTETEHSEARPDLVHTDNDFSELNKYRRIVLLTDAFSTPFLAKTAISLLRYRRSDIVAILDSAEAGRSADSLFGVGDAIPVVSTLDEVDPDALFIGIAWT